MTNPFSHFIFALVYRLKIAIIFLVMLFSHQAAAQCCTYTLTMQDSYGDSWNGGFLEVYINDTLEGKFYGQGFGSSESFEVCENDVIRLNYTPGEYENENTYQIYDAGWNIFFQDGPNPIVGDVISMSGNCNDVAIPGKHPCVALPLVLNDDKEGNNLDFSGSGIRPANCPDFFGGDLWYVTEIPRSGNMEIDIYQLNDIVAGYAVWQGNSCTGIQMMACGNTDNGEKKSSLKIYDIPAGQMVYVQIWGRNEGKTQFNVQWKDLGRVILDGSELPVISINTLGQNIPYDGKINVKMSVLADGLIHYDGDAGINIRGASSSGYPQAPYSIETREENGENKDVSLLGMPEENDWILLSNFNDRSLIRNTLSHHLFNKMGNYSPATRICEVLIDSTYKGIYIFSEKIKRDKNRVNIAKLDPEDLDGDKLTGGYILEQNIRGENNSFQSNFSPIDHPGFDVHFLYEYPDAETIMQEQKTYIAGFIDSLETRLYSEQFDDVAQCYRRFLDVPSFIDYFLVNELSRNADGFKKSIFYNKDRYSKGNKLKAGPVWDFDWAWKNLGICDLYDNTNGEGWAHLNNDCPTDNYSTGWYVRMLQDTAFANELRCTYEEYRKNILDTAYLFNYIDSVHQLVINAHIRHFDRWRILGMSGPAPEIGSIATTYAAELDTLKAWITTRIGWLDKNIPGNCSNISATENQGAHHDLFQYYPNPASELVHFKGHLNSRNAHELNIYNSTGQLIDKISLEGGNIDLKYRFMTKGMHYFTITSAGIIGKHGKIIIL